MKKPYALLAGLLLLPAAASAGRLLMVSVSGNYLLPADAAYRTIYGQQGIYPEFTLGVRIIGGFYAVGGYGQVSGSGRTPELGLDAESSQRFISAGLAYVTRFSSMFCGEFEAGYLNAGYREEALGEIVSGSRSGYQGQVRLLFMSEEGPFFVGVNIGYLAARVESPGIKLGGFKAGLSLGFRFLGSD